MQLCETVANYQEAFHAISGRLIQRSFAVLKGWHWIGQAFEIAGRRSAHACHGHQHLSAGQTGQI